MPASYTQAIYTGDIHRDTHFGRVLPDPPALLDREMYGHMGIFDRGNISRVIKTETEEAVTVFIKANFGI
jgi:hypothetical protein